MTLHRNNDSISAEVLHDLGPRASVLIARTVEKLLDRTQQGAAMRRLDAVWPSLQIVGLYRPNYDRNLPPSVDFELSINLEEYADAGHAWDSATVPAWHQQLGKAESALTASELAKAQLQAHLLDANRRARVVHDELLRLAGDGTLPREQARRLTAVLNGEAVNLDEVSPDDQAAEAAEAWRKA